MKTDVLYCENFGDIVSAYESWRQHDHLDSETSVTFSGQVFEACRSLNRTLHAVSFRHGEPRSIRDERYTVESRRRFDLRIPKVGYEISMVIYALRLFILALRTRPRVIVVTNGTSEWLYLRLLLLTGAEIVPVLHNTLWPYGYPRKALKARYRGWGERFMWRRSRAILAVSWAAAEQVGTANVLIFKPSFPPIDLPEARRWETPLRIIYAGRLEENKGIYDVLEIARQLPEVQFAICGTGEAFDDVMGPNIFRYGRLKRNELIQQYLQAHLVIVPTRSTFPEGFCMVVAEAVLLLRPIITNEVVPAARLFKEAVMLAKTDNVSSYVDAIRRMSAERYDELVEGAGKFRPLVLDDSISFYVQLKRVLLAPATATS